MRPARICGCGRKVQVGERCTCTSADDRRPSARERGYDSKWDQARAGFLAKHKACAMCGAPATVVDHKIRHRGDKRLFWNSENWQVLCSPCHNSTKQREERTGISAEAAERRMPSDLQPSAVPLVIVCGPPGGGKTKHVLDHAGPLDLIIDLDAIKAKLSGTPWYFAGPEWSAPALEERNRMLRTLATPGIAPRAWFIVAAPTEEEREQWRAILRPERLELLAPSFADCVINLKHDARQRLVMVKQVARAAAWWRAADAERDRARRRGDKPRAPAPRIEPPPPAGPAQSTDDFAFG